jgi:hypothetical protein
MRSRDGGRRLWRFGTVAVAACCVHLSGRPLLASNPQVANGAASLPACLERLSEVDLEGQRLCLRKLKEAGPAAAAAVPVLCDFLARSDGATSHLLLAAVLDVFRSLGPSAAPAAETLSSLLPYRSKLYNDRDKLLVVRLRAYIMVTLSEIGFPSSALPALLDTLAHVDERLMPLEVGAAARAVGSLGPRGREFAPYLLDTLTKRISEEEFSLERYEPQFPPQEATTVQLEAVRSLGRVCSAEDLPVLTALQNFAADRSRDRLDPRVVQEAQRARKIILERHGERR